MSAVELTQELLARIAGWEIVKQARELLATGKVLHSDWTPPLLKGLVQDGANAYRAGLVIKNAVDVDNLCSCRRARSDGMICVHSVAIGLHFVRSRDPAPLAHTEASADRPKAPVAVARGDGSPPKPAGSSRREGRRLQRVAPGAAGESIEVSVILPPNFIQAAPKGKVMIVLEAEWGGDRRPLNALPSNVSFQLSPEDSALLDAVETLGGGDTPGMMVLPTADFLRLLPALAGHPRLSLGKAQSLTVTVTPFRVAVEAVIESSGEIVLRLKSGSPPQVLEGPGVVWLLLRGVIQPLGLPSGCIELLRGPLRLSRLQVPAFLNRDWPLLQANCDLSANFRIEDFTLSPRPPRFRLALNGGLAHLEARLTCLYGAHTFSPGSRQAGEVVWLPDPESPTRYSTRDLASEQAALARLLRAGFTGPHAEGHCQLAGRNGVLSFFARDYPRLQREWEVTLEERLERTTTQNLDRIEPTVRITSSGEQWFDLEVSFGASSGERLSAAEVQRLLLSGQNHVSLKNGRIALIDVAAVEDFQEVLRDCQPRQNAQGYRLDKAQAGYVDATLRQQVGWQVQAPAAWRRKASGTEGHGQLTCPPLGDLEGVLRPYQKQGVAWLSFLRESGFGGVLADEMGLGKTLQTLACIRSAITARAGSGRQPCLVVCPTSLVFNWVAEVNRFTPDMRVLALQGAEREALFERMAESDLVVTSYALIRRDADRYRQIEFDTVILDEAQHIKNRQTQNAQVVKTIRSRHRLVLTGTPLENSVLDLWSIFDFLMPGYLGNHQDFKERYEVPLGRDGDTAAQARLARRIRPFLLRRLKREVAADLPEKIEQVAFCDLTEDQAGVYRQVLDATRREVQQAVGEQGLAKSRMVVLTALLRLRQVCCDLRLLKLEQVNPDTASGKLDLFGELLEEVLDGGHRVLVFSQFVGMLTLLREKLAAESVDYCYLDGSTQDRAGVVARFQNNGDIPVFLISLKAGGTGLNLTGADTVIHFDPWWNPAVEAQATDRAHRIGQTRVVTSYKLITRGTVEEKILSLQNRKRELLQTALGGEEQMATALTWEEIQDLLAG